MADLTIQINSSGDDDDPFTRKPKPSGEASANPGASSPGVPTPKKVTPQGSSAKPSINDLLAEASAERNRPSVKDILADADEERKLKDDKRYQENRTRREAEQAEKQKKFLEDSVAAQKSLSDGLEDYKTLISAVAERHKDLGMTLNEITDFIKDVDKQARAQAERKGTPYDNKARLNALTDAVDQRRSGLTDPDLVARATGLKEKNDTISGYLSSFKEGAVGAVSNPLAFGKFAAMTAAFALITVGVLAATRAISAITNAAFNTAEALKRVGSFSQEVNTEKANQALYDLEQRQKIAAESGEEIARRMQSEGTLGRQTNALLQQIFDTFSPVAEFLVIGLTGIISLLRIIVYILWLILWPINQLLKLVNWFISWITGMARDFKENTGLNLVNAFIAEQLAEHTKPGKK